MAKEQKQVVKTKTVALSGFRENKTVTSVCKVGGACTHTHSNMHAHIRICNDTHTHTHHSVL